MKINFVLPHVNTAGGIRSVLEIANHLVEHGDTVNLIYPAVPLLIGDSKFDLHTRAYQAVETVRRYRGAEQVDWFDVDANVVRVPSIHPRVLRLSDRYIPNADVTVAISWETAYAVNALSVAKGDKYYFMQHYEIWPLWNDERCWEQARREHPEQPSLGMATIDPHNRFLSRYKQLVDNSYNLPMDLILTSEWERKIIQLLEQDVTGTVKYGVNTDMFYPSTDSDTTTVLALYRNSDEKGDQEAIAAFRQLHAEHPGIRYVMFGLKETAEIPDFVEFHEDPSQDHIRDLYSRADIFLYPSWVEGYGMPPMEAMACNTALVSTDVGAVREYTPENGVTFVPVRDVEALVSATADLIGQPDRIDEMKTSCFQHIQQYTWKNAAEQFKAAIQ